MTKQDMIRDLKRDLEDFKQFAVVVLILITLFGTLISVYKGYLFISDAVVKALEPTAEEKAAEKKAAEKQKLLNELIKDCERRCPVGMPAPNRYAYCYDWAFKKVEKE